jgi:hypothetical protein
MADLRPADDESILDDDRLYVRIFPSKDVLVPVEGGHRPMSGSMKGTDRDDSKSVDLASLCTPEQTRDRGTNGQFHVAAIPVSEVRRLGLRIKRDPLQPPDPPNSAHALIVGSRQDGNGDMKGALTNGEYEKLARVARIVLYFEAQAGGS